TAARPPASYGFLTLVGASNANAGHGRSSTVRPTRTIESLPRCKGDAMAGIEVMEAGAPHEDGYQAPSCKASGVVHSSLFQPEGFSLWEVEAVLGPGTTLEWGITHGDEVVYVLDGELEITDRRIGPKGAAIVESGVAAYAHAPASSRILHFGPASPEPPQ